MSFTEQFTQFSDIFSTPLADISNAYEHVFIYGDFNLNILDLSNKFIAEYVETIFSYGFLQLVTRPTRVSGNSATLIDHILTNSTVNCHDSFILCSRLSDHFPVIHQINFNKTKEKKLTFESRNFSQTNIKKFKDSLSNFSWNHVTEINCTQEATNNFLSTFDTLFNA